MIKLNNKNITYVALADSNNSLKAPKEIWYADSSNSVKLVYRRKDALIEGIDYEKYHWLVGDADAYINTLKYYRPYDDSVQMTFRDNLYPNRESKYNKYNKEEQIWGACETNNLQSVLIRSYISGGSAPNSFCNNIIDGNTSNSSVNWGTYATQNYINESPEHSLYISSVNNEDRYYFIYNGNTKNNLPTRYTLPELVQQDVRIFYSGIHDNGYFNGSFFNFIHYRNNVEITHLIPCQLLKPVPKWLDANGIRRQIGECGMIDLVSGKFYGNVNSVGTFTVENYYERKEWLVGDGSAYIDTLHLANEGLLWETHVSNLSFKKYFVWNRIVSSSECPAITLYHSVATNGTVRVQNNYTNSIELRNQTNCDYIVATSSNGAVINGVQYIRQSASENISNKSIKLFYCDINESAIENTIIPYGGNSQDVCCAYFRFLDSNRNYIQNLIPCTLTMDLPASMDANNIARTKGTSGMWDLVSDRFYGNVANSGTFKAVNLTEGVDYEVHDWLVGEISSIGTLQRLPINSSSMSYKVKRISGVNFHFFRTDGYDYYYRTENFHLGIYDLNQKKLIYSTSSIIDNEIDFECSAGNVSANGVDIPIYGFPIKEVRFHAADNGGMKISTSSITVDGIERYIPVKLLRSIPYKYDANGIARQAGECGMYDTVNDVFYGNVASSGTFSVSDDE